MLDLSPEKLIALLAIGLVVLGPERLPAAARSLAGGLVRIRKLTTTLTEPIHSSLAEPRQVLDSTLAEVRSAVAFQAPAADLDPCPQQTLHRQDLYREGATPTMPADPTLN